MHINTYANCTTYIYSYVYYKIHLISHPQRLSLLYYLYGWLSLTPKSYFNTVFFTFSQEWLLSISNSTVLIYNKVSSQMLSCTVSSCNRRGCCLLSYTAGLTLTLYNLSDTWIYLIIPICEKCKRKEERKVKKIKRKEKTRKEKKKRKGKKKSSLNYHHRSLGC